MSRERSRDVNCGSQAQTLLLTSWLYLCTIYTLEMEWKFSHAIQILSSMTFLLLHDASNILASELASENPVGVESLPWPESEKAVGDSRPRPTWVREGFPLFLCLLFDDHPDSPFGLGDYSLSSISPSRKPSSLQAGALSRTEGHTEALDRPLRARILGRHGWAQACNHSLPNSPLE